MCGQAGLWRRGGEAKRSLQSSAGHSEEDRAVRRESSSHTCISTCQVYSSMQQQNSVVISSISLKCFWNFLTFLRSCCCASGSFLERQQRLRPSGSSTRVEQRKVWVSPSILSGQCSSISGLREMPSTVIDKKELS